MSKYYLFFLRSCRNVGGAQLYVRSKAAYLREQGWNVAICSGSTDGAIRIKDFETLRLFTHEEFLYKPAVFSKSKRKKLLKDIVEEIKKHDECVIESGYYAGMFWAEYLAGLTEAKHLIFSLLEAYPAQQRELPLTRPFFRFKEERGEYAGITQAASESLFGDPGKEYPCLTAAGASDSVLDVPDAQIDSIPDSGIKIGIIGRFVKKYVTEAAKAVLQLAEAHRDEQFYLVMVGDGENAQRFRTLFEAVPNVFLLITGELIPIPENLFRKVNCFVGSAACANIPYRHGSITISVDAADLKAIGVMGYTTFQPMERTEEAPEEIADLLEKVLFTDYLSNFTFSLANRKTNAEYYREQEAFLADSAIAKQYYPVIPLLSRKDRLRRVFFFLFGIKVTEELKEHFFKVFKK